MELWNEDEVLSDVRQYKDECDELNAQISANLSKERSEDYVHALMRATSEAEKRYSRMIKDAEQVLDVSQLIGELASLRRITSNKLDFDFLREREKQVLWQRQKDIEAFLIGVLDADKYRNI